MFKYLLRFTVSCQRSNLLMYSKYSSILKNIEIKYRTVRIASEKNYLQFSLITMGHGIT